MDERQLVAFLDTSLRNCAGWESDDIAQARTDALNYYLQRARGDEVPGRSTVVAGDVSSMVEANLAQMMEAYSTANIIEFDPLGADDIDQAGLESDTVVYFVMKSQNGYMELQSGIKNALMLRNGFMKCWVSEFEQSRTRTFENVQPEAASELAWGLGAKIIDFAKGILRLRGTRVLRKFRAESVAPENFFYPLEWDTFDLQSVPFCAERQVSTRSDLVRMGFSREQVAQLKPYNSSAAKPDNFTRNPGRQVIPPASNSLDPSLDQIEWFECYALLDVDDDGIAERRRIAYAFSNKQVLGNDPCMLVPYSAGAAFIMPHRLTGISEYDKLRQTQDEHTGLKRAQYDNVNAVTKARLAYLQDKVNAEDLDSGRPNGSIRVDSSVVDIRTAIMPLQVPDNSANIQMVIESLKRERSELGGAALDMASAQLQIGGDRMGSQGLDRAYSAAEQLASMMTKNIAQTLVRNTFLLAHATLRLSFNQPVSIRRNGNWSKSTPTKWMAREAVTVKPGMSPGERARKSQTLLTMLDMMVKLAQQGMDEVMVTAAGFYRTAMDWARVNDIANPEAYWRNPSSPEAQKALQQKSAQAQANDAARKALMSEAIGIERMKVALDKYKADQETEFKYWAGVLDSEVEEAKIVGDATTELLKAREVPVSAERKSAGGDAK